MLHYVCHDLFASPAQTLVNTVNTVGVMGKGIAKEFRRRFPAMYERYRGHCKSGAFEVGQLYLFRTPNKWVLNFPTKRHWRNPSQLDWIEAGLDNFARSYEQRGITSVSFPQLGCGNGGLDWARVKPLMDRYLRPLPIPVFVHTRVHDPNFVPEHLVSPSVAADEPQALSRAPEHVSFPDFFADFLALFGRSWQADERSVELDTDEPPPLPKLVIDDGDESLRVTGESLETVWAKFIARGALPDRQLPGFRPRDSELLARHLRRLSYVESIAFVEGSFAQPRLEHGIRYAPPPSPPTAELFVARAVEQQAQ